MVCWQERSNEFLGLLVWCNPEWLTLTPSSPSATAYPQTGYHHGYLSPPSNANYPSHYLTHLTNPLCLCGRHLNPFGNHIFQCRHINKIGAHNSIRDGFVTALAPLLSTAGYLLPLSKLDVKLLLHLLSDPHAHPFDLSFNPGPTSLPLINHACPYTTIGFDVTIASPPPCPSFDPTSSNVTTMLTANADSHLQKYENKKISRDNKTDSTIGITTTGDTVSATSLTATWS